MKMIYKMLLVVALFCSATWQMDAQTFVVPPTDGSYFYIQFSRGTDLVLENKGSGVLNPDGTVETGTNFLKTSILVIGKPTQLWRAEVNGDGYTFISQQLDVDGTTQLQIAFDPTATADNAPGRFIVVPYSNISMPLYTTTTGITTTEAYLPACAILTDPSSTNGMNPWGGSDINNDLSLFNIADGGSALRFVLSKSFLFDKIASITKASLNPGTRSAEVQAALQAALNAAQAVYDDPNTTNAQLSAAIDALNNAFVEYDAVLGPPTDDSYFYIQFKRGTNLVLESTGNGNPLQTATLVYGKGSQLWRAEKDNEHLGAFIFVSKEYDNTSLGYLQISWDDVAGRYIAISYTGSNGFYSTTRDITLNTNLLPASVIMRSASAGLAMNPIGSSDPGRALGDWNRKDDGCALTYTPESTSVVRIALGSYLTQANTILESASHNPGSPSVIDQETFRAALTSPKAVYDDVNSTVEALESATNALIETIAFYNSSPAAITPIISSADATNEKWYFFQGTRPDNTYLTSMGAGALLLSKTVIPDDTQLWKIVPNTNPLSTNDGYALINKSTGEYMNTDPISDTRLNTTLDMPMTNIIFNISTIKTNGVARFWVENSGTTSEDASSCFFRLHAGDQGKTLNWTGNRNDNSSWLIMDYSLALKGFLKADINAANAVLTDGISVGTALGQYPSDAKPALITAIATAQALYDNASASDNEIKTAIINLNTAVAICKGRKGDAVISTVENPRWFVIRNLLRKDVNLVKNHVVTTNGVLEDEVLLCKVLGNTNEQLWRFESNATGGVKIINAAKSTLGIDDSGYDVAQKLVPVAKASGYIIDSLGTGFKLTSIAGNQLHEKDNGNLVSYNDVAGTASNWAIEERTAGLFLPQTLTFDAIPEKLPTDMPFDLVATTNVPDGTISFTSSDVSVALVEGSKLTIFGVGTAVITATNSGNDTYAQASVQQTLTVRLPNGLNDISDGIRVSAANKQIVVIGTDAPVKVFTVTGVEVNAKRVLASGIYIVKVAGKTVKVNVR
jgi:hypothetical protein